MLPLVSRVAAFAAATAILAPATAGAAVTFDFESTTAPLASTLVIGDKVNFASTAEQAISGFRSLKFVDGSPLPFDSWTYDLPQAVTSGTVSVWFYDSRGPSSIVANPQLARWGGSIVLEDKTNPADFVAVEISELPYGGGRYYGTEGTVDRLTTGSTFDSVNLASRTVGWHKVSFAISPTRTLVSVDATSSSRVAGPGGAVLSGNLSNLRFRVLTGSASNGGAPVGTPGLPPGYQPNWFLTSTGGLPVLAPATNIPWVSMDDLALVGEVPNVFTKTQGFETPSGTPEYDTVAVPFPVPIPSNNDPLMDGFVNQFDITTSASFVRTGVQAAYFRNPAHPFRSVAFNLAGAAAGDQITVRFYDAVGPNGDQSRFGGAVILEESAIPANFRAVEVWNFPYPFSGDPTPGGPNYYLTKGTTGTIPADSFDSRVFGNRTIGWHTVVITLGATASTFTVDGIGDITKTGPGLNTAPRLRLMGDSPTAGGFDNYTFADPLGHVYFATKDRYVYYDQIQLPVAAPASVTGWALFD